MYFFPILQTAGKFNYIWYAVLEVKEAETWWFVWHLTSVLFVTSGYNTKVCGIRHKQGSINVPGTAIAWGEKVRQMNHVSPHPIIRTKMRIGSTEMWQCFRLSGVMFHWNIKSVLGLLDTWRCRYCVRSKFRKPPAEWQSVTPNRPKSHETNRCEIGISDYKHLS
jgi:hypothetical protein